MKKLLLVLCLALLSCEPPPAEYIGDFPTKKEGTFRIAFGSCSKTTLPQPLWKLIINSKPDVWIWLGDIIYADTEDMQAMKEMYELQLKQEDYTELRKNVPIIGVWDDHDYGMNDGHKDYRKRRESQQLLLDFLGEPADSLRRKQEGVYWSYSYGEGDRQVKVILLDTRYHSDPPGEQSDLLGEAQWRWLENELRTSKAQVNILASSIQVISEEHKYEKWANYPASHRRLFSLLAETKPKGLVILSGDRHFAELSRKDDTALGYPLYDLTSSGLTHASNRLQHYPWTEPNRYRVGKDFRELNFGLIDIDWQKQTLTLSICGPKGLAISETIQLSALQPASR